MKNVTTQITILFLLLSTVYTTTAQTVTYDNGAPRRPTSVTGLEVNGIIYNITIQYNQSATSCTDDSGLPLGDEAGAATALTALLNTQATESQTTMIDILAPKPLLQNTATVFRVGDYTTGQDDWVFNTTITHPCATLLTPSAIIGRPQFTHAPPPVDPIPTMSQWGLLILGLLVINLSVFYVHRRELI